jgi:hypothetical protein
MATSGLDKLLGRDMPEIAYLKQTNIAQVLSKGLAETFRVKPTDPKTYFAKFLLNYAHEKKIETLVSNYPFYNGVSYILFEWTERGKPGERA